MPLVGMGVFCYSPTDAYAFRHLWLLRLCANMMLMALRPSSFPPSNPCAPWTLILQHWRLSPPELFASDIQDAHHGTHPAILHSLHSVAHEPDEEPNRLQGGGSHRRVYDCCHASLDNCHTHIDDVPRQHRHFAARHIIRLMLHYSPRFRICWGWVSSCHPVCTALLPWRCLPGCFRLPGDAYALGGHGCFLLFADLMLMPLASLTTSPTR